MGNGRSQDAPMPASHEAPKAVGTGLAGWQRDLAVRLLLSDLSGDFPVAELAGHCGLSRSYFGRAFKVSMGLPPHRWLMRYRVQRAQEMLERTTESIVAIAASCGFADQSHLTRVFHAIVGASPAAWRRRRKAGVFQRLSS
jgi:AraC family transcriptional regulator